MILRLTLPTICWDSRLRILRLCLRLQVFPSDNSFILITGTGKKVRGVIAIVMQGKVDFKWVKAHASSIAIIELVGSASKVVELDSEFELVAWSKGTRDVNICLRSG
jgi:hypothetical protein